MAASPLRNSFFPEPGSIGEKFIFSRSTTGSSGSSSGAFSFDFITDSIKEEPAIIPEVSTTATVLQPVTLNVHRQPEAKVADEKKRFDDAAAARARTREVSRYNAMAKDPFSHERGASRKKRTVDVSVKPLKQQNVNAKGPRAEPLLFTENVQPKPKFSAQ